MISPTFFDIRREFPLEWEIQILEIDKYGFSYKIITNSYKEIYGLKFYWLAIYNEKSLQIKYLHQMNTSNLQSS
jgi:hypothetical protein